MGGVLNRGIDYAKRAVVLSEHLLKVVKILWLLGAAFRYADYMASIPPAILQSALSDNGSE